MSAPFPSITNLHKRDETTKRLNGVLAHPAYEYLADAEWVFTEKIDGTNIRVIWDGEHIEIRGRTDNATLYPPLVAAIRATFSEDALAAKFGTTPATLYGEGYGAKVQNGHKYRPDQGFILFDALIRGGACAACSNPHGSEAFCTCRFYWLERENLEDIAKSLGCEIVPAMFRGNLQVGVDWVREGLVSRVALEQSSTAIEAEGVIGRPATMLFDRKGERIQVKIKARDYREARS